MQPLMGPKTMKRGVWSVSCKVLLALDLRPASRDGSLEMGGESIQSGGMSAFPVMAPVAYGGNMGDIDRFCFGILADHIRRFAMQFHATTILAVRRAGTVALGGDGQVSLGNTIMKGDAAKIRRLAEGKVMVGFAGSAADSFALMERFETKLKDHPANLARAATELAKEWRTDRALRRLEAMLITVDAQHTLLLSGSGDVIQPADGIVGIGSGGNYAVAAARALVGHSEMGAAEIVRASLTIAAGIDVYTNTNITVEELACET